MQLFRLPDGTLDWELEQDTRPSKHEELIDSEIDEAEAKAAERREFDRRTAEFKERRGIKVVRRDGTPNPSGAVEFRRALSGC